MKNSSEKGNEISNNFGILSKIIKFIKNIFKKDNIKYISAGSSENSTNINNSSFLKSIKFEENPEKTMLLKIQDDFEKMGINKENAYKLTKNLTDIQKAKLENLYIEQIKNFETSIKNHKNKIITMRKKLAQTNN